MVESESVERWCVRVAAAAECDIRTVKRWRKGRRVRSASKAAIERVVEELKQSGVPAPDDGRLSQALGRAVGAH